MKRQKILLLTGEEGSEKLVEATPYEALRIVIRYFGDSLKLLRNAADMIHRNVHLCSKCR